MATSLSQRDTRVVNGSISAGIDVFLSYSRRDKTMADRLRDAFAAAKREVWMDVKDILPTEEWPAAIRRGIEAADNFVFLLSPDSVSSDDCRDELNHAIACGKRLIPLLYREAKHNTVPTRLGQIEWIRFDGQVDFEVAFRLLLEAIDTDLVWKHAHTELLQRAAQWQARGRNDAFVLRGSALREAEGWLAHRRDDREPSLSELQTEFIVASQQASRRTLLRLLGGVAVALIVAIALAVLALAQWYRAESERRTAVSRELAVSSNVQREVDPELSVLLATESLGQADTAEAQAALREVVEASHIRATLRGHGSSVNDAVFSPDGKQVATAGEDGTTRLWDASTGQQLRAFSGAGYANTGGGFQRQRGQIADHQRRRTRRA